MSYIVKAGTPFLRYTDPMIPKVNPRGLQPQSSFSALLTYATGQTDVYDVVLNAPPDGLSTQILLFGADYPQRFTGTQYFGFPIFDENGDFILIDGLTFTVPATFPYGLSGIFQVPDLLASQAPQIAKYQEKVTGSTATNGVSVTGFPFFAGLLGHGLWASDSGNAGDRAGYAFELNMALDSGSTNGPAAFLGVDPAAETLLARQPVILWEPDFTQQIVDDGFQINAIGFNGQQLPIVLDVVGVWCGIYGEDQPYSPLPPQAGLLARGAAPAAAKAKPQLPYPRLPGANKGKV